MARPDKVVIIVVDALSKEIVEKFDMPNVEALMADGVDTPRGYLGWTNEGFQVFTVSPKGYAAYGLSGPGSVDVTALASGPSCNGVRWRRPAGIAVPPYIAGSCGSRYWVERDTSYDTLQFPAQLYPATDDRYVVGDEPGNQGGDVWTTDAVLDIMDREEATPGYDPMTHMRYATATADAQVGRIMDALEESGELDSTLVVLTADHGSVAAADGQWRGDFEPVNDYGYYNWYYGDPENDIFYDKPQEALQPLIDTGNVGLSSSDSAINVWLTDQSPASVAEAAAIMKNLPDVTAVWQRRSDHFDLVSPIRWDRMGSGGEKSWFARKARELVDTQAAPYGPDLVATLPDDTTYSVLGDHGGIQRTAQQIPIVFAGANLSDRDLRAEVTSVDIMPTILKAMGIAPTSAMDGTPYDLPRTAR